MEQAVENLNAEGIIVFGCGHDGRETKRVLDLCKINLDYFVDSDYSKVGTKIGEYKKIIALEPLVEMCNHIKEKCTQEHIRSVQIEEAAAWNKKEKLFLLRQRRDRG